MPDIVFWGATGHSRVLHEALRGSDLKLVAVIDNRDVVPPIPGIRLLRGESGLNDFITRYARPSDLLFSVAVGGSKGNDRLELFDAMKKRGITPHTIVHRTAFLAADAVVGEACQLLPMVAVCACAHLGRAVIVNTSASIDHDCEVGNGAHIGPGAHLAGQVKVGDRSFVGTGAVILPGVRLGADCVVGAGSVVLSDVPAFAKVAGNPARQIKKQ
jgi:sugar O-acyltransferase (sialic acid O-acetyltransferase NeuD family)